MVQLSDELISRLDTAAAARGLSRSALIRELLTDGLRTTEPDTVGERIAEGYRRVPQLAPDEWGDPAAMQDTATRELLRRLDAEERAAGHPPW